MPAPAPSSCANGAPTRPWCWSATTITHGDKAKLARVIYRHMKESAGAAPGARGRRHRRRPQPRARAIWTRVAKKPTSRRPARPRARSTISASTRRTRTSPSRRCARRSSIWSTTTRSATTLIKGIGEIHQTFLPKGVLGALDDNPYKLDVAKAKELLAKAGLADGFTVTMDVRNTPAGDRHRRSLPADAWRRPASSSRSSPATASRR